MRGNVRPQVRSKTVKLARRPYAVNVRFLRSSLGQPVYYYNFPGTRGGTWQVARRHLLCLCQCQIAHRIQAISLSSTLLHAPPPTLHHFQSLVYVQGIQVKRAYPQHTVLRQAALCNIVPVQLVY